MGLLDMQQQQPMQQGMQGGLLGGGMSGMPTQGQGGAMPMPPEMMQVVQQIKMMQPDQKNQAIQQMAEHIQKMPKSDQEKQQAIQQFMTAVQ